MRLRKGDHVWVLMKDQILDYEHHGIFIGNHEVIDFVGGTFSSGSHSKGLRNMVRKVSLEEFLRGSDGELRKVRYSEGTCYDPDKVVERANRHLGRKWGGYDLLENNCEHFATWCKTGARECDQYLKLRRVVRALRGAPRDLARRIRGVLRRKWRARAS